MVHKISYQISKHLKRYQLFKNIADVTRNYRNDFSIIYISVVLKMASTHNHLRVYNVYLTPATPITSDSIPQRKLKLNGK